MKRRALTGLGAIAIGALVSVGCAELIDYGADPPPQTDDAEAPDANAPDAAIDAPVIPRADAGPDADADAAKVAPEASAELLKCEADLAATWRAHRPSFGLGAPATVASYDSVIHKLMDTYAVPGAVVAVTRNGRLVLAKGYGFSAPGALPLVQSDSTSRIAALSTTITSAAIFTLVDAGKLSLDDKAFTILKNVQPAPNETFNPALSAITVRHLLQHTAGWNKASEAVGDPMFDTKAIAARLGVAGPAKCDTVLRYMASKPLTYAPGQAYSYSNFGYCVLGAIIEAVSGMTYEAYVKANVLDPAGATGMALGHALPSGRGPDEVSYVDYPGASLVPSVFGADQVPFPYGGYYLEGMGADSGWVGSAVDLMRFQTRLDGRATAGPALLTAASLAAMTANPHVLVGTPAGATQAASTWSWLGAAWAVNTAGNWWLGASLPGVSTIQVHAANGFGWTAMFNTRPQDMDKFGGQVDSDLWVAFDGTGGKWLEGDLFDQYGPMTEWMSPDALDARIDVETQGSRYASRVEGAVKDGATTFRARFSPLDGIPAASVHGVDCLTYKQKALEYATGGYQAMSLQTFVDATGVRRYQAAWAKP